MARVKGLNHHAENLVSSINHPKCPSGSLTPQLHSHRTQPGVSQGSGSPSRFCQHLRAWPSTRPQQALSLLLGFPNILPHPSAVLLPHLRSGFPSPVEDQPLSPHPQAPPVQTSSASSALSSQPSLEAGTLQEPPPNPAPASPTFELPSCSSVLFLLTTTCSLPHS